MTLLIETPRRTKFSTDELIEKLYQTEGKAEIINGEIIEFTATGDEPGMVAANIWLV
jgi:Uma2 family endonuclease